MQGKPLYYLTIAELASAYAEHELSPVEVTRATLERIDVLNPRLLAYTEVTAERAMADATASERRHQTGGIRGPLDGVPIGLKDIIDTAGIATTCGTGFLRDRIPIKDARLAANIGAQGGILLGKQHMLEWAMGGVDTNVHFGTCRNPWNDAHFSGGSSTGAGAAVASGMAAGAVGTDTGGSVRQPASYCGIVGLKPTAGLVSLDGVFTMSPTCDTAGPITRTVEDNALLLAAMLDEGQRFVLRGSATPSSLDGLTLGTPRAWAARHGHHEVVQAIDSAIDVLSALGASVHDVPLDFGDDIGTLYRNVVFPEMLVAHGEWFPSRTDEYGPHPRSRLEDGLTITAEERLSALEDRARVAAMAEDAIVGFDAFVLPTQPTHAPAFDQDEAIIAGKAMSTTAIRGLFTLPWSIIGWPGLSIPCGFTGAGLPVGLQIVGRPHSEALLYRIAAAYEGATTWASLRPPL